MITKERKAKPSWELVLYAALFIGAALAAGLAAGLENRWLAAAVVLGPILLIGVLILLRYPEVGLLVMVFLATDLFFINQMVDIRVLGGGFELRDLFLFFMWIVVLVRALPTLKLRIAHSPVNGPLLVFMGLALLAGLAALVFFEVPLFHIMRELRAIMFYSMFFVILVIVFREAQLRFLLWGLLAIALMVAVVSVAQYVLGSEFVVTAGRVEAKSFETGGLTRVLLPASFLVNALFIVATVTLIMQERYRFFLAASTLVLGLAVVLTWSRNLWLADLVVLSVLFFLLSRRQRARVLLGLLIVLALVVAGVWGLALLTEASAEQSLVDNLVLRATEFFQQDDVTQLGTVGGRLLEAKLALPKILTYPFLGIGPGNSYYDDPYLVWQNPDPERAAYFPRFIHIGYLWIPLKMGWFAFAAYLLVIVQMYRLAYSTYRHGNTPFQRSLAAGLGLAYLGMTVSGMVVPIFTTDQYIITLATLMGLLVSLRLITNRPGVEA